MLWLNCHSLFLQGKESGQSQQTTNAGERVQVKECLHCLMQIRCGEGWRASGTAVTLGQSDVIMDWKSSMEVSDSHQVSGKAHEK